MNVPAALRIPRSVPGAQITKKLLVDRRDELGWTQQEASERCRDLARASNHFQPLSAKTIQRMESGRGNFRRDSLETYCHALGLSLVDVVERVSVAASTGWSDSQTEAIAEVCRVAVAHAMRATIEVQRFPHRAVVSETSERKITDSSPAEDPTEPIDAASEQALLQILGMAFENHENPLSEGFLLVTEEQGAILRFARQETPDLAVFIDSVDDTRMAARGLGGTVLICVYHRSRGWICTVIGDVMRNTLYCRVGDRPSYALRLQDPPRTDPFASVSIVTHDPVGTNRPLRSSGRVTLEGCSINVNLGKPGRLLALAREAPELLETLRDAALLSEGGSRGMVLVAEGLVDMAVEVAKGYRTLDFVPGGHLAAGVPRIVVCDLQGHDIGFGPDPRFEEILDEALGAPASVDWERTRQKFVVAATRELADLVVAALHGTGAPVHG